MAIVMLLSKIAISIHALREEGDLHQPVRIIAMVAFLSTPSARRATLCASAPA